MKVWVLEKFASPTEMIKTLISMIEIVESSRSSCSAEDSQKLDEDLDLFENKIEENPSGFWSGFEGKTSYKQFCNVAKDAIERNPDAKFRVVEGEIDDKATTWINYRLVSVNDKVLKYLYATLKTRETDWSSKYRSYTMTDTLTTDMLAKLSTKTETK